MKITDIDKGWIPIDSAFLPPQPGSPEHPFVACDPGAADELHVARWKPGTGLDFWKWSPESEAHTKEVLAKLGIPESFLTDDLTFSSAMSRRHKTLYKWWYRRDGQVKAQSFKIQRSAKARKRKAVRNFVKPTGAVAFDIEAGEPGEIHFTKTGRLSSGVSHISESPTGRLNKKDPATYELTKDGYVRHEPR